jgi:ABC-2 type transport system permease protein
MNVFKFEMRNKLSSMLIWTGSMVLLMVLFMAIFPAFSADAEGMQELIESYPPEFLAAFNISNVDLSTVMGYFTMIFVFAQVALAVQASNYGVGLLSVEERMLTADFLLTKPVNRVTIVTSKLISSIIAIVVTNIGLFLSTYLMMEAVKGDQTYDTDVFLLIMASTILFQLFFLGVGMFISMFMGRIKNVLPVSMGLAFGMYFVSMLGSILEVDKFDYFTPFKYFDPNYILLDGQWDTTLTIICVVIIVISVAASYILYQRRNIPSV